MITVKNLTKKFGSNTVLKDISFTINKGEKIVIVGPSGSGKSTFLRCLNLLEEPTSGEVWFDGTLINSPNCDIDKHRQKMGMVFQLFNLFSHMTILKNLTYAPVKLKIQSEAEARVSAMEMLKRVGLEDKAEAYPSQLSGGQKQRIAIVRSLMSPQARLTRKWSERCLML